MERDVTDKIEKLWKLLAEHNTLLEKFIQKRRKMIESRNFVAVGDVSGTILLLAQSDVCYATLIEVLEELIEPKQVYGG